MTDTTKTRSEAPLAALILGIVSLAFAFAPMGPGIPVIAGAIAVIAAAVDTTRTQREDKPLNVLTVVGLVAALIGMLGGFTFLGA
jgi:hypothetical protein